MSSNMDETMSESDWKMPDMTAEIGVDIEWQEVACMGEQSYEGGV